MVQVRNVSNTADEKPTWDDLWKDYWERISKRTFG